MGRAKLQMKKIESTIKRQVTFSKRRNGLIKKAYEISVLCDVDVLLIMFSPSDKLSWFSGNKKRVEDILARFVSLPEHDRGRLPDEERFLRIVKNLNNQSEASAKLARHKRSNFKCHFEKHQNEFMLLQNELAEAEKQLKVFEEGAYKITTIYDAEHYQTILKETLSHVQVRKKILEEKIIVPSIKMHPQELCANTLFYPQPRNANANVLYARGVNHVFDCAHQQVAQFQTNHVFGSVGLLPMSYQKQPAIDFTTLVQRNEFQLHEHLNGYVGSSSTATSKISLAKVTTARSGDDEHSSSQTLFPM